jgi:hypothetical protein
MMLSPCKEKVQNKTTAENMTTNSSTSRKITVLKKIDQKLYTESIVVVTDECHREQC